MKHFVVDIHYTAPLEEVAKITDKHREFLQTGYDAGIFLASGPKNPRTGGVILARHNSYEELKDFLSNDPYNKNNVAEYTFTEFNPVKLQPFMQEWAEGK